MLRAPNDCKGCTLVVKNDKWACRCTSIERVHKIFKKCPCIICLVKVTCKQQCNEFSKFQKWAESYDATL